MSRVFTWPRSTPANRNGFVGADTGGIYAPRSGYLLFVRQGTLLAQSFSPKTLALADEPFAVAEQVESLGAVPGIVAFSLSGLLAYGIEGGVVTGGLQMVWVDRQGKPIETVGPEGNYRGLDLAPNGKRVAVHRHDGQGGDIWLSELPSGPTSRFTFDASQENSSPIWSPDGSHIVFGSLRGGKWGLYQNAANQAGTEEPLVESDVATLPVSWSPDGLSVVYETIDPKTQNDLWVLRCRCQETASRSRCCGRPSGKLMARFLPMGNGSRTLPTKPAQARSTCGRSRKAPASGWSRRTEACFQDGAATEASFST